MRKFIFIVVCSGFLCLGFECSSGSVNNDSQVVENTIDSLILWSPTRKLKWTDYQGFAKIDSEYKALTYATVELEPIKFVENNIVYNITCWFETKLSWSIDKESPELLSHEQLHFDIAELATRKLRQKFQTSSPNDLNHARELILQWFDEEEAERASINRQYDTETEHGIIKSKQKEWELKISKELKALDAYSSTRVSMAKAN